MIASVGLRYNFGSLLTVGAFTENDYEALPQRAAIGFDLDGLMPYATVAMNSYTRENAKGTLFMYGAGLESALSQTLNLFVEYSTDYAGADLRQTDIDFGIKLKLGG